MSIPAYTGTLPANGSSTYDSDMQAYIDWFNNQDIPAINSLVVGSGVTLVFIDHTDSPYQAVSGQEIWANTTGGAITILGFAGVGVGDNCDIFDWKNTFNTNNVTFDRNTKNVEGAAANYTLSTDGEEAHVVYTEASYGYGIKERS